MRIISRSAVTDRDIKESVRPKADRASLVVPIGMREHDLLRTRQFLYIAINERNSRNNRPTSAVLLWGDVDKVKTAFPRITAVDKSALLVDH